MAAASLAITAWGTFKAAQVANDQLAQSKEDSEMEELSPASRVTMWGDGRSTVVANRTLDPVWVSLFLDNERQREMNAGRATYIFFGVVPPCTAVQVPNKLVHGAASSFDPVPDRDWVFQGMHFLTMDGRPWVRYSTGRLLKDVSSPPMAMQVYQETGGLVADSKAKASQLPECRAS
ncbi:hypothetical protein ACWCPM_30110 [Streptomyces sp. NPDC002309]